MSQGWIKLHRKITHCMFWMDKPFDKARAWIDLLLMANHEGNKFLLGNETVEVERGSFITSIRKLTIRWGWSSTKVSAFLRLLQNEKMIVQKSDTKKTLITVMNWDLYQSRDETEKTEKIHEKDTKKTRKNTNKNDKNEKNEKKLYKDFVMLSDGEHEKLVKRFGQYGVDGWIERLNNYAHQKPKNFKQYSSHYHTILNWADMEAKRSGTVQSKPQERQKTETELEMEQHIKEMKALGRL